MAHQSDSAAQREAQELISKEIEKRVGKKLSEKTIKLDGGAPVRVDGVDTDESVFVEIFAGQPCALQQHLLPMHRCCGAGEVPANEGAASPQACQTVA